MCQCPYRYFYGISVFSRYTGTLTVCRFAGIKFFPRYRYRYDKNTFFSVFLRYIAQLYVIVITQDEYDILAIIQVQAKPRMSVNNKDNCDRPRENRPSSHLGMIVEIPVLKVVISITSFCSC